MTRKVEVISPQKEWEKEFEREQKLLKEIFSLQQVEIYHIGSTGIKTAYAKPVIDLLMVVKDIEKVDSYNQRMTNIGYACLGENGIINRRFFTKGGDKRSHHLHVFQVGNPEIDRHLLFKDYMNHHPEDAAAYSQLKVALARKFPYDIESYVAGKNSFIKTIDQKAQAWYAELKKKENKF